jgi:hypothetical protein
MLAFAVSSFASPFSFRWFGSGLMFFFSRRHRFSLRGFPLNVEQRGERETSPDTFRLAPAGSVGVCRPHDARRRHTSNK